MMTSGVPRVGHGGGGCAEVRLVLRLVNESITNVTEACHQRDFISVTVCHGNTVIQGYLKLKCLLG